MNTTNRFHDAGQLILRVGISALMMTHGWPKLQKLMAGGEIEFFDFMWMGPTVSLFLAVVGEFFAPLLIIFGYRTRWAALVSAFTMGVAAFYVHLGDPLGDREAALMYFIGFLAITLLGAGAWSVDAKLSANND
ncbi:MAG: DoxX family protein [Bacteroidota bacterium]|jgi:putative oxidoreductase